MNINNEWLWKLKAEVKKCSPGVSMFSAIIRKTKYFLFKSQHWLNFPTQMFVQGIQKTMLEYFLKIQLVLSFTL